MVEPRVGASCPTGFSSALTTLKGSGEHPTDQLSYYQKVGFHKALPSLATGNQHLGEYSLGGFALPHALPLLFTGTGLGKTTYTN